MRRRRSRRRRRRETKKIITMMMMVIRDMRWRRDHARARVYMQSCVRVF